jgi:hypothetical protein|tara:strand:- start:1860 stop:2048 length:189 start_codon:yes stop_codon:yes gene_type:complete
MSTKQSLIGDYWNGGSSGEQTQRLIAELTDKLKGITYTQTCTTAEGTTYKKLVIEYEDSSNN